MKRSSQVFLLLVIVFLFFVGCEAKNNVTPREGGIQGAIVDPSGKGVASVKVTWLGDPRIHSLTDFNGKYLVDGVIFGEQSFSAEKSGFKTVVFKGNVFSNGISTLNNVTIASASFLFKDITVKNISATTAVISFTTSEFTNAYVEFGESETLGRVLKEPVRQYSSLHSLSLTDLVPEKRYFYRITATRQGMNAEVTEVGDFFTKSSAEDGIPPASPKSIQVAMTEKVNQVTITWSGNTEADLKGYKIYRSELPAAGFLEIQNTLIAKGRERYIDAGVFPGKKYYYRVSAIDVAGNEGGGSDIVSILVPGDVTQRVVWSRVHNPYLLIGDLDVRTTGVVEIEPGVEVRAADFDALQRGDPKMIEIRVTGSIVASAGSSFPVTFSSARPNPQSGDWGGIFFNRAIINQSALVNVTIAHAKTGLAIFGTPAVFNDILIADSLLGVSASGTSDLTLASITMEACDMGMVAGSNNRLTVRDCTIRGCPSGMFSYQNDTVSYLANNFLEYTNFGLLTDESGGSINITDNLFVAPVGIALHVVERNVNITYNTFDVGSAIRIDQGNPVIEKNIIYNGRSLLGNNSTGIEYLASSTVAPVFGPNDVAGFASGSNYIGCASTTTSLALVPDFYKDFGGRPYDYRLYSPIPDLLDIWGIRRTQAP